VSLEFLTPVAADDAAIARSPMERLARAAGARFELREGWNVAVWNPSEERASDTVGWADVSHLRKFELQGEGVANGFGTATRSGDGWLCPLTPSRALVVGAAPDATATPDAIDVTTCFAALTILGPLGRELIARFCAIDLRPQVSPPGSFRPGSIARQPGMIVCEAPERFLLLFGWAVGEYMWTVVQDAGRQLGGAPVGVDALPPVGESAEEVSARA
jgi:glycine cleavage system aminomethyltransferase T